MPAYLYQAPTGIPGAVTRVDESNVDPAKFASADCPAVFGFPVVFTAGVPKKWSGSSVAADFQGVLVREVPAIAGTSASDASFDGTAPWYEQVMGVCVRGYVNVKCVVGSPARGGVVYIQITASGGVSVGDFRADGTDGGNAVALSTTQATWACDGVDAANNAELRIAR
jgi:hypothetical protein